MPGRRPLAFASLDDVMPDVDRLLHGHEMVGSWSLGQVCRHLARAFDLTIEGLEVRKSLFERLVPGRLAKWYVFRTGGFPEGRSVPSAELVPPADLDERAEAEALRASIAGFLAHPGPLAPHFLLGRMSVEEWRRFHAIHCAHHLSFALPR